MTFKKIDVPGIRDLISELAAEGVFAWEEVFARLDPDDCDNVIRAIPALRVLEDAFIERRIRRRARGDG